MTMMQAAEGIDPAWFGIAMHLHADCAHQTAEYLSYLGRLGFVNRPIINDSFICQPSIAMYCKEEKAENYPGSSSLFFSVYIGKVTNSNEWKEIFLITATTSGRFIRPTHWTKWRS